MFTSLALTALKSERHNQYSPMPTIAACLILSLGTLGILTFAPGIIFILALVVATLAGCVFTATGMIGWALLTDASRTRSRIARETFERLASVEEEIARIYSLLVSSVTATATESEVVPGWNDAATVREMGELFSGTDTYDDIVILRDAIPVSPEDYMASESEWSSVLPGYRGTLAKEELADYSNDDRTAGDRVLTYCAGTGADHEGAGRHYEVATESRREEWRHVMSRVTAEMDLIMAERAADLAPAPVVSEPCPLSVLADDGCPHHSMSWKSGELVAWTPTMNLEGGSTKGDHPVHIQAACSPVVPTVEEVAPLKVVAPVTPEGWDWANDAGLLAACKMRGIKANVRWKRATMIAQLEAHEVK